MKHYLNHDPAVQVEVISRTGDRFTLNRPVSWDSQHSMNNPVQSATVGFKGTRIDGTLGSRAFEGKAFYDAIQPFDCVHVTALSPDGNRYTDVYGVAGKLTTDRAPNGDESTFLPVYSLGEPLIHTLVFWHAAIAGLANLANIPWLKRAGEPISGPPPSVIKQIYRAWFNDSSGVVLADGRRLDQAVRLAFHEFKDSLAVTPLNAMNMEGSVWEAMKNHADTPFGELFTAPLYEENKFLRDFGLTQDYSTIGNLPKMAIHLRPMPFVPTRWDTLARTPGWNFSWDDSERVGGETIDWWNTSEVNTFFWCFGQFFQGRVDQLLQVFNDSGGKIPIVDEELLRRYGLRKFEQGTRYVEPLKESETQGSLSAEQQRNASSKTKVWEQLAKRSAELALMFGYEKMAGGNVTLRGRIGDSKEHGIRLGSVMHRNHDGGRFQFYCDNYAQSWGMGRPWSTTVSLSRGIEPDKWRKWYTQRLTDINLGFLKTDLNAAFSPFGARIDE